MKRWLTEFTAVDGDRYAGPILIADSQEMAVALLSCLQGPNGQALRIIGELLYQVPAGDAHTESHIRRAN